MNDLVVTNETVFVAPHYIEELGCDGLTAEEIATSLGADVDVVRRKLRERGEYVILVDLGVKLSVGRIYNNNGVEFEEFFLSTEAAKLFVARYQNEVRDGFLKSLVVDSASLQRAAAKVTESKLTPDEYDYLLTDGNGKRLIELEKKYLAATSTLALENKRLKKERELREKGANEYITEEGQSMMDRVITSRLNLYGKNKPKYRRMLFNDLAERFFTKDKESEMYGGLPRKNLKAAIEYIKARRWSIMEGY